MEITTILGIGVGVLLILNISFFVWFAITRKENGVSEVKEGISFLQRELQDTRRSFDTKISQSVRDMEEANRFDRSEAVRAITDVYQRLTTLDETNKQVLSVQDQMKQLQDILNNPKQRGILGEFFLENVLNNVLPSNSFQMQYLFPNGEIVDAVVFVKEKIIPIDSKFSLENYNRLVEAKDQHERERYEKLFKMDLKTRIDETSKYVRVIEGTTEFAFMFIPSEGVYYDILNGSVGSGVSARDLIEYAFTKKVIIVSPTSFLAYLQTVLQGLKALQIEESAKEIRANVQKLQQHMVKWEEYYKKLGKNLGQTVSAFNDGYKELTKVEKDIVKITGDKIGIEPLQLSKPEAEEV